MVEQMDGFAGTMEHLARQRTAFASPNTGQGLSDVVGIVEKSAAKPERDMKRKSKAHHGVEDDMASLIRDNVKAREMWHLGDPPLSSSSIPTKAEEYMYPGHLAPGRLRGRIRAVDALHGLKVKCKAKVEIAGGHDHVTKKKKAE